MKKLIRVLLIAALIAGTLTSCGGKKELTTSNYDDYLCFEAELGEVEKTTFLGTAIYDSTFTIKVYPVKAGSFSNTTLTVSCYLPFGWSVDVTDPAYDENEITRASGTPRRFTKPMAMILPLCRDFCNTAPPPLRKDTSVLSRRG